jgi:Tol biopolymer transport system component
MGSKKPNCYSGTGGSHSENSRLGVIAFALAALGLYSLMVGCQTQPTLPDGVTTTDIELPSGYQPPPLTALTAVGVNSKPELSHDGSKVIYLSSLRPTHENTQAYMLDLVSKTEKRITFQDGQVASVVFSPDDSHVIYSSSTDEIKEDSLFIKESLMRMAGTEEPSEKKQDSKLFWKDQPLELYSSFLNGTRIERLTKSPQYDSDPDVHPLGKKIIFASARGGQIDLHLVSNTGTYLKSLTSSPAVEAEPRFSPDGSRIVWVEYQPSMKESHIVLANQDGEVIQKLTSAPYIHWNPHWSPDGKSVLISSNREAGGGYEVFRLMIDNGCLERLTWHSSNDTEPAVGLDGVTLYFTSDRSGTKQVYQSQILPAGKCK